MNCRNCRICNEWIALYEEEKARREQAEHEASIQKEIRRMQKESFDGRLAQMSKAVESLKARIDYLEHQSELANSELVDLLAEHEAAKKDCSCGGKDNDHTTDDCVELLAKALGGGTTGGCQGRIAAPNEPIPKEWLIV